MCGIIGILGHQPVAPMLLEGLRRLKYRGYDSAGIATLEDGRLDRRRAEGKLKNLEAKLLESPLKGTVGIGHTRWATHGKPTENNAHPHISGRVAVVHNGIIENFRELRLELKSQGYEFKTETDTEVIAHLINAALDQGLSPQEAIAKNLPRLKGAFALALLFEGQGKTIIGVRRGPALAIGYGEDENEGDLYLGSDALALVPFTNSIAYLEDGDSVVLSENGAEFFDISGQKVTRQKIRALASAFLIDKGNYRHFMAKEIHEQPEVVGRTLAHYLDMSNGRIALPFPLPLDVTNLKRVTICACGTAYMAGLVSKYWFERFAKLNVNIEIASEFRYAEPPMEAGGLVILVSQSGETADSLAALRHAKACGQKVISVVNVTSSSMARESDCSAITLAGPEIGVASTKAFTCQLAVLAALALGFARERGFLDPQTEAQLVTELMAIPGLLAQALESEHTIELIAREIGKVRDVLYLGRGTSYPLALEGALKLKELSYIHAEGYAAGELKHGPIALIDDNMPVIIIAPRDNVIDKTISNMQEVSARGGRLILIGDRQLVGEFNFETEHAIIMPETGANFASIIYAVPIQLLAYHTAVFMGKDADQPRNLAKSVTVE